jgi:ferredoxin
MILIIGCKVSLKTAGIFDIFKLSSTRKERPMATPKVDMDLCIGCGLCSELCPKVFELRDDKAWVINDKACDTCDCQQAVDSCPVTAISLE